MTASHSERIIEAVVTAITNAAIPGATITRERTVPVPRSEGPAIQVMWVNDDLANVPAVSPAPIQWAIPLDIKIVVRGDIPDQVADPFKVAVHSAICADLTLGGLTQDITPFKIGFESLDADNTAGIMTMQYILKYRTATYADLTS